MRTSDEKTYTVAVTFTVYSETDAHLQTQRAIRGEVRSWLESLNVAVRDIHVVAKKVKRREARDK